MKWMALQVELSPPAGFDIEILRKFDERRRQKIARLTSFEAVQRSPQVLERKVDQTIPTQNDVHLRQLIASNVPMAEHIFAVTVFLCVVNDQLRHNIHPEIPYDRELQFFHPMEIATSGIE